VGFPSRREIPGKSKNELMSPEDTRKELQETIDWVAATGPGYFPDDFYEEVVQDRLVDTIMSTLERYDAQIRLLGLGDLEMYGEYAEASWMHSAAERLLCPIRMLGEREHWYFFWYTWND